MQKEKMTPATEATSKNSQVNLKSIPTKHELCLLELLKAGTKGIHKIGTPSDMYGETCLPTTISQLKLDYGFEFIKVRRKHQNKAGGHTHFTWYSLANKHQASYACIMISKMRTKRGNPKTEQDTAYFLNLIDQFPEASN